ncbi:hypothetical protein BLNAU_2885 [Blattamonas nauphoetae]|uniref:Uncharacterized protein n=1 Tax=Blattamonas nauphoetae TaxID=2049346 RepID=A0ABQ9YEY9_9EUKA|nr:hypothetical protein BLNAU_2885 [Blattamonas nauphoetae]
MCRNPQSILQMAFERNSETSDSSFYESVIGESRYNDQHVPFYISLDRMIKQYPELFSQKEKEKLEEPDHDIFLSLDESQSDAISSTASKMFNLTNSMVNSLLDPESKQSAGSNALVIQAALQSGVSRSIINQALRRLDQLKNRINETPDEDTMLVDNSDDDSTPT